MAHTDCFELHFYLEGLVLQTFGEWHCGFGVCKLQNRNLAKFIGMIEGTVYISLLRFEVLFSCVYNLECLFSLLGLVKGEKEGDCYSKSQQRHSLFSSGHNCGSIRLLKKQIRRSITCKTHAIPNAIWEQKVVYKVQFFSSSVDAEACIPLVNKVTLKRHQHLQGFMKAIITFETVIL